MTRIRANDLGAIANGLPELTARVSEISADGMADHARGRITHSRAAANCPLGSERQLHRRHPAIWRISSLTRRGCRTARMVLVVYSSPRALPRSSRSQGPWAHLPRHAAHRRGTVPPSGPQVITSAEHVVADPFTNPDTGDLSEYSLSESDAGSNTTEYVQLRSEKSADTAPFFPAAPSLTAQNCAARNSKPR